MNTFSRLPSFASELDDEIPLDSLGKGLFDPTVGSPVHPQALRRIYNRESKDRIELHLPYIEFVKDEALPVSHGHRFDFTMVKDDFECSSCRRVNHAQLRRSFAPETSQGRMLARKS